MRKQNLSLQTKKVTQLPQNITPQQVKKPQKSELMPKQAIRQQQNISMTKTATLIQKLPKLPEKKLTEKLTS